MAGFLSWVQFILKLWSCLLPGQKLILSGNVLVHFLFLLSTGKNGINTKLFKSSEFGYCLFLVFFFFSYYGFNNPMLYPIQTSI